MRFVNLLGTTGRSKSCSGTAHWKSRFTNPYKSTFKRRIQGTKSTSSLPVEVRFLMARSGIRLRLAKSCLSLLALSTVSSTSRKIFRLGFSFTGPTAVKRQRNLHSKTSNLNIEIVFSNLEFTATKGLKELQIAIQQVRQLNHFGRGHPLKRLNFIGIWIDDFAFDNLGPPPV